MIRGLTRLSLLLTHCNKRADSSAVPDGLDPLPGVSYLWVEAGASPCC